MDKLCIDPSDLYYKILFCMLPGCGPKTGQLLLEQFGGPEAILTNDGALLSGHPELPPHLAEGARSSQLKKRAWREVEFILAKGIRPIWITDNAYPYRLRECTDAPLLLYQWGKTLPTFEKVIAVVGTRRASRHGEESCRNLITGLVTLGFRFCVVSGLASGIDTAAHTAALSCGMPTYAILGQGLQTIYPSNNRSLARTLTETGALLTEFSSSDPIAKANFVRRNRIIAGLSDAVIVVESGIKGGAMRTATMAHSYNREVLAVPGRPSDYYAKGCNLLIKTEIARMVECSEDIAVALNWDLTTSRAEAVEPTLPFSPAFLNEALPPDEQQVMALFSEERTLHIDQIGELLGFSIQKTAEILMKLVIKGALKSLPGQSYQL
ncbi:MAG: DNA-processing protein DprA [Bacteroidales bacterium]